MQPWRPHRDAPPLPTDPLARKARVKWLEDHKVWCHPVTITQAEWDMLTGGMLGFEAPPTDDTMFDETLKIRYVYVNPETLCIDDDDALNTKFRIWLEAGPPFDVSDASYHMAEPKHGWNDYNRWETSHDHRLNADADDLETALLRLAALVDFYYDETGKERADVPVACDCDEGGELADPDGFCTVCGHAVSLPGVACG